MKDALKRRIKMKKKNSLCNLSSESSRKARSHTAMMNAKRKTTKINLKDKKKRLEEWRKWWT